MATKTSWSNLCAILVGVWLTIDGERYDPSGAYVDLEAERARIAQALFRCEVEQLHLADGRRVLVNWRSVRLVHIGE
ncbi:hypothetical protein Ga0074812_13143 [Parafrankia irregularis]|uniref:Uncharacterized protein n=1 Tax=Parafrankia irregularis TaxID=795642 RepID=A0A0S4QVV2_9ACTN|nr:MULTISPECIES: hypothetical protein [Frankiaceae]MBE3204775.1 hypothetical protein [Parafrankia sp. CH37]CUU59745.1 hypothetical protein Ga0074812_13143 [Parafrankia irregularis]